MAQENAQRSFVAVKEMAKTRGEAYLEYAKVSESAGFSERKGNGN
jgi:hypothetical protein